MSRVTLFNPRLAELKKAEEEAYKEYVEGGSIVNGYQWILWMTRARDYRDAKMEKPSIRVEVLSPAIKEMARFRDRCVKVADLSSIIVGAAVTKWKR